MEIKTQGSGSPTENPQGLEDQNVENNKTPAVGSENKPEDPKLGIWKQARKTADNQLLKGIRKEYGLDFETVAEFKGYLGELLKAKDEKDKLVQEDQNKTQIDKELKEQLSTLKKQAEQLQVVQKEKETIENRYKEDRMELLFRNALTRANCNDIDLLVGNKGIFSKLQLDPDMRDLTILDDKGEPSMETLDDYVEKLRLKHPKMFTAIKAPVKSDIPEGWDIKVGNTMDLMQKQKAGLEYLLKTKKG